MNHKRRSTAAWSTYNVMLDFSGSTCVRFCASFLFAVSCLLLFVVVAVCCCLLLFVVVLSCFGCVGVLAFAQQGIDAWNKDVRLILCCPFLLFLECFLVPPLSHDELYDVFVCVVLCCCRIWACSSTTCPSCSSLSYHASSTSSISHSVLLFSHRQRTTSR